VYVAAPPVMELWRAAARRRTAVLGVVCVMRRLRRFGGAGTGTAMRDPPGGGRGSQFPARVGITVSRFMTERV
jgi:hypothetical protein